MHNETKNSILVIACLLILLSCRNSTTNTLKTTADSTFPKCENLYFGDSLVNIEDIYGENAKTVIYLTDLNCSSCSHKELAILNSLPEDYRSNIIVWGKFNSNRNYKIFASKTNVKVYRIKNVSKIFENEILHHNYIFVLQPNGIISEITDITENPTKTIDFYLKSNKEAVGSCSKTLN